MLINSDKTQLKIAFKIVWLIFSILIFILLLLPYILPHEIFDTIVPKCSWKQKYNKECIFCGMTNAFFKITNGNIPGAYKQNNLSIFVYTLFVVNEIVFLTHLLKIKILSKWRINK